MKDKSKKKVLIIGAGISGITFARGLPSDSFEVTLFDKSQGVGGRIATRRFEESKWDHGVPWIEPNLVPIEDKQAWLSVLKPVWGISFPRLIAPEGLTQLPKSLCSTFTVCKGCKVVRLEISEETSSWSIEDDKGGRYSGDILILTMPAPQAHELLLKSNLLEPTGWDCFLSQIVYRPQMVALGKSPASFPSLWKLTEVGPFELILDNGKKGINKSQGFFTAYLNTSFSREHFEDSDETALELIRHQLKTQFDLEPEHLEIKRWRYSQTTHSLKENFLIAKTPLPLFFIGDGLAGGQLAGAIHSATRLAQHLKSFLN
jgi:renalase